MRVFNYILCVICAVILVSMPFIQFSENTFVKDYEDKNSKQTIISFWHIETFEGGVASRGEWLKKRALEFERKNSNVFVNVQVVTETECVTLLEKGHMPDLISFSQGIGEKLFSILKVYDGSISVEDNFIKACSSGNDALAVPWCVGGYSLIGFQSLIDKSGVKGETLFDEVLGNGYTVGHGDALKKCFQVSCGFAKYNNPVYALSKQVEMEKINKEACNFSVGTTQYSAYEKFVSRESSAILLGSQRDVHRIIRNVENGKFQDVKIEALARYTDLLQVVGITKKCERMNEGLATKFIEFLTCKQTQVKLVSIGMFNVIGEKIYSNEYLSKMENAINNGIYVENVFTTNVKIQEMRNKHF